MSSTNDVEVDVAIFGGGIAGLWLLDQLVEAGYSAALFEAHRLGTGQTVASQGIIHGGTKYTFGLAFDSAVKSLRAMPTLWRDCVEGNRAPDLSSARVLSPRTHMWLPKQAGAGLLGAFSRILMRSRVEVVPRSAWPVSLDAPGVQGAVYALDEVVLDVPSVLAALQERHRDRIRRIPALDGETTQAIDTRRPDDIRVGPVRVKAQRVALMAGRGNAALQALAGLEAPQQQLRPLHQVMVAGMEQPLYAHCVGRHTRPLATVTSHPTAQGDFVWWIGGGIAEAGVASEPEALIDHAREELPRLFPAADFGAARFATHRVDRAEALDPRGRRPNGPVWQASGAHVVAWPTKLALAPVLADHVLEAWHQSGLRPGPARIEGLAALPQPEVARPPWEEVETWS